MIEVLAIPAWQTEPTELPQWVAALEALGGAPVSVVRDSPQGSWLELGSRRLRGFAMMAASHVEAINFELSATDAEPDLQFLRTVAASLGWEIHQDDAEDGDDDDEDDDDE